MAAPFAHVDDAMQAAPPGSIVAVAKGHYDEDIELAANVTLWGACVSQTVLASSAPIMTRGTLNVLTTGTVKNVTLSGARPGLFAVSSSAHLTLTDVWVRDAQYVGVYALSGARVAATNLLITGIGGGPTDTAGRGIVAQGKSQLTLQRVSIENTRETAVSIAEAQTTLTAKALLVRHTQSRPNQPKASCGVMAGALAKANVTASLLEQNQGLGACAIDNGVLTLEDSVIRGTTGVGNQERSGIGASALSANLTLNRVSVIANGEFGVSAEFGTAFLNDVLVLDTQGRADGTNGLGLVSLSSGRIDGHRVAVEASRAAGVVSAYGSSTVTLTDVTVRGTLAERKSQTLGIALALNEGAQMAIERAELSDNVSGVFVTGNRSTLIATDVVVRATRPNSERGEGRGIEAYLGAQVIAARMQLQATVDSAMFVASAGTLVTVTDLTITGTKSRPSDGTWGRAVQVQDGATLQLERAVLADNRECGINVWGPGSAFTGRQVEVRSTLPRECAIDRCDLSPMGINLMVGTGGYASLQSFRLTGASSIGVLLHTDGAADLSWGEISSNPIAVNVTGVDGFDLSRLDQGVSYVDNAQKLSAATVPLPELGGVSSTPSLSP